MPAPFPSPWPMVADTRLSEPVSATAPCPTWLAEVSLILEVQCTLKLEAGVQSALIWLPESELS
ncbi:Uncharacterised protein [uncultured archaeon]|nr:Uncharacterised protein [uncultured archaeon]